MMLSTILAGSSRDLVAADDNSGISDRGSSTRLMRFDDQGRGPNHSSRKIRINKDRFETVGKLPVGAQAIVERLPLSDGRIVDVELTRLDVLTEDAYVRVMRSGGKEAGGRYVEERIPFPDVVMLSGRIVGDPDSVVFLSADGDNVMGYVRSMSGTEIISSGSPGRLQDPMIHKPDDLLAAAVNEQPGVHGCGLAGPAEPVERRYPDPEDVFPPQDDSAGFSGGLFNCRKVRMSVDIDTDLLQSAFGGDRSAALVYAVQLAGAQNQIYTRDVGINLALGRVTVWETEDRPWTRPDNDAETSDMREQLDEYQAWYLNNISDDDYDIAHLLVSDQLGGGMAFLKTLCSDWSFALSSGMTGSFPYPQPDYSSASWDLKVFAHENGHVLGAIHTHEFCPPIDSCAPDGARGVCQPFTVCQRGTIMSYCHTCPGGLQNTHLKFHAENALRMREHAMESPCTGLAASTISAFNDNAITNKDCQISIDVLANDMASCEKPLLSVFDSTTSAGGTVEVLVDTEPYGQREILYTPPAGFTGTDTFTYTASVAIFTSFDTAEVEIEVIDRLPAQREILVLDSVKDGIYRFDAGNGDFLGTLVETGAGELDNPSAFDVGPNGDVYVTSLSTHDVRVFDGATGASNGVLFENLIKTPIDIKIDDRHAYILGSDVQLVFPWEVLPRVKLVKVHLQTGQVVGTYLGEIGFGRGLDLRKDGSLAMIQNIDGRELLMFDPATLAITTEIDLGDLGVDNPISVDGYYEIAILDSAGDGVTFISEVSHEVDDRTSWDESELIDFDPRQIVHDTHSMKYCLHERGVSRYGNSWMSSLITISPEHLQSPHSMVFRDVSEPVSADFNGDGFVNGADLSVILGAFGTQSDSDLTGDGFVDGADLAMVLVLWSNGSGI
jgi:hypothetical protein